MDRGRVAEISIGKKCGTGYLIRNDLIITARHVVGSLPELGTKCDVRFCGDWSRGNRRWLESGASLCWQSEELDVALLKLEGSTPEFVSKGNEDVKFGKLGTEEKFFAKGGGFPSAQRSEKRQNFILLEGKLDNFQSERTHELFFDLSSVTAVKPEGWHGLSGTAVFVHDHLVGIVVQTDTDEAFGPQVLRVIPISLVAKDQKFCELSQLSKIEALKANSVNIVFDSRKQLAIGLLIILGFGGRFLSEIDNGNRPDISQVAENGSVQIAGDNNKNEITINNNHNILSPQSNKKSVSREYLDSLPRAREQIWSYAYGTHCTEGKDCFSLTYDAQSRWGLESKMLFDILVALSRQAYSPAFFEPHKSPAAYYQEKVKDQVDILMKQDRGAIASTDGRGGTYGLSVSVLFRKEAIEHEIEKIVKDVNEEAYYLQWKAQWDAARFDASKNRN
ncbi:serine protease [Microcoleus sp. herbarium5]|uniref:serine protease n=1 Tax=Microcoleus sp. herbarium5 TaxID=3055434 RepID=UPI002FD04433